MISDGVNPAVTETVTVMMQDTTVADRGARHPASPCCGLRTMTLIPVTIWANGEDNGGGSVALTASVQCSEADGQAEPDWIVPAIDNAAGTVALSLRAERTGSGDGRVYTVTITATDGAGNQSSATVDIRVPHDKRKK